VSQTPAWNGSIPGCSIPVLGVGVMGPGFSGQVLGWLSTRSKLCFGHSRAALALSSLLAFAGVKLLATEGFSNANGVFVGGGFCSFPVPLGPCWVIGLWPVAGQERPALGRSNHPAYAMVAWQLCWPAVPRAPLTALLLLFELTPRTSASSWPADGRHG